MSGTVEELSEAIGGSSWPGKTQIIPRTLAVAALDQLKAANAVVVEFGKWNETDEGFPHEEFIDALHALSELFPQNETGEKS